MTEHTPYHVQLGDGQRFGPASMETIVQWTREGRVPRDAHIANADDDTVEPVESFDTLAHILRAPPTSTTGVPAPKPQGSALLPTGNPSALTGYYLAVFSLVPGLVVLAPIAVLLGVAGLVRARRHAEARGRVHAWIAVIGGTVSMVGYGAILIAVLG